MVAGTMPIFTGLTMATGNIKPKKSLGQHWLTNQLILSEIIDLAELSTTDTVLEIGPGKGHLTKLLASQSKVVAVELDKRLTSYLISQNLPNTKIVNANILDFDFLQLPKNYKLIANIPYYLTGQLISLISQLDNRPSLVVLLVQKEIAERLSAKEGNLSVLGLSCQYFWQVELGPIVPKVMFEPIPKVDSQIVKLTPKPKRLDALKEQQLFIVIKAGFRAKRKTVINNLSANLNIDKIKLADLFKANGIKPNIRPQDLNLDHWIKLSSLI